MNGLIGIAGVVGLLLIFGGIIGVLRPRLFDLKWLAAAGGLVLLKDVMLTRAYGLLPDLLPPSDWNWQGKIMALAVTLAVASLPAFGWHRSGLTFTQAKGSLASCVPVAMLYALFFVALAHFSRAVPPLARPSHSS